MMPEEYLGNVVEDTVVGARGVCIGFMYQLDEEPLLHVQNHEGKSFWIPVKRTRVISV